MDGSKQSPVPNATLMEQIELLKVRLKHIENDYSLTREESEKATLRYMDILSEVRSKNEELRRENEQRIRTEQALQKAKEEAEESSRLKSHILANISHEFRTPLTAIMGYAEIMLKSNRLADVHQRTRDILSVAERFENLIETMLDSACIEAGQLHLGVAPFDLPEMLGAVREQVAADTLAKGLNVTVSMEPEVGGLYLGDEVHLRRVLWIILENAVKFTEQGSVQLVVARQMQEGDKDILRFSITDTGIGIAKEIQQSIMDPFHQGDAGSTRKYGGTGLGLTLAKRLIELMRGSMELHSVPGEGTTVEALLPLTRATPEGQEATKGRDALLTMSAAPGCRVLLAAPCSPDRELLAVLLEDAGCIVQCIETPDEFSDIILHADCDLAVVDAVDASLTEAVRAIGTRAEDAVPILGMVPRDTSVSENANLLTGYISMPVQVQDIQGLLDALLPPEEALHTAGPAAAESFAAREPPIDWAMTAGEFGGDNDMVKTLVSQFLAKVHTQIEMLRIACSDPDLDPARAEAHKIKGGAANLNAVPLSEAARRLEQAAGSGDPEESRAALQALMTETERLTNFMENIQ